jgi:hypothetical protein
MGETMVERSSFFARVVEEVELTANSDHLRSVALQMQRKGPSHYNWKRKVTFFKCTKYMQREIE